MEKIAETWLRDKVSSEIIGLCCDISNICGHKYPFDESRLSQKDTYGLGTYRDTINNRLSKISMLIYNFGDYIGNNVIDDYFTRDKQKPKDKQNHWGTEAHIRDFKCFINEANVLARDKKLNHIING